MATSADWLTSFAAEGFKSSGPGVERRLETPAIGEAPSDTAREGEQAAKEEHLDTPNLDTPNFHTPDKQPDTPQTGPVDPGPEPTHLTNATVDQVPDSQPVGDTAPEKTGSPASHHEFHDVADADNREDKERGKEAPASPGPDGTVTEESAAIESTPEGSNAIERQDMERVKTEKVTSQEPPSDTETTAANPTLSPNRGEDQEAKLSPGPPTAAVSRVAEENHSETPASPPSTPTPAPLAHQSTAPAEVSATADTDTVTPSAADEDGTGSLDKKRAKSDSELAELVKQGPVDSDRPFTESQTAPAHDHISSSKAPETSKPVPLSVQPAAASTQVHPSESPARPAPPIPADDPFADPPSVVATQEQDKEVAQPVGPPERSDPVTTPAPAAETPVAAAGETQDAATQTGAQNAATVAKGSTKAKIRNKVVPRPILHLLLGKEVTDTVLELLAKRAAGPASG